MTGHHPRAAGAAGRGAGRCCRPAPRRTRRGRDPGRRAFRPRALDAAFRLFRAALRPLAEAGKLGYVLFQFAPWVHFEPRRLEYLASLPAGCRAGRWPSSSATARGFPTTPTRRCGALRAARLAHVIVDAPGRRRRHAARDRGDRADGGLAAARPQRRGLAAPAPRRGAERAREVRLPLQRRRAGARWCRRSSGLAEESEEVFVSFNNNNRDYPVRNALDAEAAARASACRDESLPRDLFA